MDLCDMVPRRRSPPFVPDVAPPEAAGYSSGDMEVDFTIAMSLLQASRDYLKFVDPFRLGEKARDHFLEHKEELAEFLGQWD